MAIDKTNKGKIAADIIEVRFAFSGKVSKVIKKPGDRVAQGELLASLETKFLQAELDRELADYERVRAEFEIFGIKVKDPQTDIEKYEKTRMQALLNSAVKAVELAKYRMDQVNLTSPVAGIIISDEGLRPGMYITPGSYGFEILDLATLHFELEIPWSESGKFAEGAQVKVVIEGKDGELTGQALSPLPILKSGACLVRIKLESIDGLWPGMEGEVSLPQA